MTGSTVVAEKRKEFVTSRRSTRGKTPRTCKEGGRAKSQKFFDTPRGGRQTRSRMIPGPTCYVTRSPVGKFVLEMRVEKGGDEDAAKLQRKIFSAETQGNFIGLQPGEGEELGNTHLRR